MLDKELQRFISTVGNNLKTQIKGEKLNRATKKRKRAHFSLK